MNCPGPTFLLQLVGPHMFISGAVFGEYVCVDRLTSPIWLGEYLCNGRNSKDTKGFENFNWQIELQLFIRKI